MTKETRGYWELKEEALDHTLWRTCFGKRLGICRDANYRMDEFVMVTDCRRGDKKCIQGFAKHLRGRDSLEDRRGWNETTELHLDEKGTRLLNGLIWYWTGSRALLNKIRKYAN
jgi:hypothetical protein